MEEGAMEEGKNDVREGRSDVEQGRSDVREGKNDVREGKNDVREGKTDVKQGRSDVREGRIDVREGRSDVIPASPYLTANTTETPILRLYFRCPCLAASAFCNASSLKSVYLGIPCKSNSGPPIRVVLLSVNVSASAKAH